MSKVVAKVDSVEVLSDKLKLLLLDVGGGGEPLPVVTNAPNVGDRTVGKKVVVATVGCEVGGEVVTKRSVGGKVSEGMICDCPMLGWSGGAAGNAVLVPDDMAAGSPAPSSRPRGDGAAAAAAEPSGSNAKAAKEAEKAAKKAAAKAAREAKKKDKKTKGGKKGEGDDGAAEEAEAAVAAGAAGAGEGGAGGEEGGAPPSAKASFFDGDEASSSSS